MLAAPATLFAVQHALGPNAPVAPVDIAQRAAALREAAHSASTRGPENDGSDEPALDVDAFAVALWNPAVPPPPPPSAPPTLPPPVPRYTLLGIEHDGALLRAVLFDPDGRTVHVVAAGDRLDRIAVVDVRVDAVVLAIDGREAELLLDPDPIELPMGLVREPAS